jgi:transcriptional regulator with XRE-family HTH domain
MRRDLGLTQAELARRLKVALPTVGKWESYSPPGEEALEQLALFAERNGLGRAALDFRYALVNLRNRELPRWVGLGSAEESRYIVAVLEVMKNEGFADIRRELDRLLQPALEATASQFRLSEQQRMEDCVAGWKAAKAAVKKAFDKSQRKKKQ